MNSICFDLEGPLASQDNAYELMQLFPHGGAVFEVISRYDDLLALEEREDYEPGDTLALIVPFLLLHGITEDDITGLARKAKLIEGSGQLIAWLQSCGWKVFCISTSYQQYAWYITQKLGIFGHNVACTSLPLGQLQQALSAEDITLLKQAEAEIISLHPVTDDTQIKQRLDDFFVNRLPATSLGRLINQVKPVGGRRKIVALDKFADKLAQPLARWVVVGDSITDFRMLGAVDEAGGLAVAFNANQYALPYATMSLASTSLFDLKEVLEAWAQGQRRRAEKLVTAREAAGGAGDRGNFHWLSGRQNIDDIIQVHHRIRRLVREEASKLG